MKKLILLVTTVLLFTGCTTVRYHNQFGNTLPINKNDYESVKSIHHFAKFKHSGCPVYSFYDAFDSEFDDIVNISISEKHSVFKLFFVFPFESATCDYTGTGVKYKAELTGESNNQEENVSAKKKKKKKKKEAEDVVQDEVVQQEAEEPVEE